MRDIAIVSYVQSDCVANAGAANEVELIMPVVQAVLAQAGLARVQDVDFTCSGSCDYQQGAAFAFVTGVDALGAVPPIVESHVEMDAAWALYEAILKIRMGQADSALRNTRELMFRQISETEWTVPAWVRSAAWIIEERSAAGTPFPDTSAMAR